ncbi:hypothetical protein CC79DRAFT_1366410 [Sarocladium strictum]
MDNNMAHDLDLQDLLQFDTNMSLGLSPMQNDFTALDQLPLDNNSGNFSGTTPRIAKPRNRNPRSCDFCRSRKTACVVESSMPCNACRDRGLQCTFAHRRRRKPNMTDDSNMALHQWQQMTTQPRQQALGTSQLVSERMDLHPDFTVAEPVYGQGQGFLPASVSPNMPETDVAEVEEGDSFSDTSEVSQASDQRRNARQLPLDQPTWTYMLLSDSGEGDPHLLKRSALAVHADNIHFRRFPRDPELNGDLDCRRPIVFMLGRETLYSNYEPRIELEELDAMRVDINKISSRVGARLIKLFFQHVHPYFPILSRTAMLQDGDVSEGTLSSLPLSLKAVLYAVALPYMIYDDVLSTMLDVDLPTAKTLYRISWTAITQEIHIPRLSTLQACLLLLQRDNIDRYVQGSPFQWSLMAWTVSLAQTLGLPTDCSTVRGMPAWEKRLRKRLWWATYVLDKWNFATTGLASHIHADDYDVLPLTDIDCQSSDDVQPIDDLPKLGSFRHLVDLTHLLAETTTSFFTVRATRLVGNDFAATMAKANDLQYRLSAWKTSLDTFTAAQSSQGHSQTRARLDGNASLIVAFWALQLLIHRAILRALEAPDGTDEDKQLRRDCRQTARRSVESCCGQVADYVDQLRAGAWNAFWHKFSPSNFAIVSSILMRLLITSTSQAETTRLNELIDRWRWVLRNGGGNIGGAMMSLGLLRLDRTLLKSRS